LVCCIDRVSTFCGAGLSTWSSYLCLLGSWNYKWATMPDSKLMSLGDSFKQKFKHSLPKLRKHIFTKKKKKDLSMWVCSEPYRNLQNTLLWRCFKNLCDQALVAPACNTWEAKIGRTTDWGQSWLGVLETPSWPIAGHGGTHLSSQWWHNALNRNMKVSACLGKKQNTISKITRAKRVGGVAQM
jgi:hypothetical protein